MVTILNWEQFPNCIALMAKVIEYFKTIFIDNLHFFLSELSSQLITLFIAHMIWALVAEVIRIFWIFKCIVGNDLLCSVGCHFILVIPSFTMQPFNFLQYHFSVLEIMSFVIQFPFRKSLPSSIYSSIFLQNFQNWNLIFRSLIHFGVFVQYGRYESSFKHAKI